MNDPETQFRDFRIELTPSATGGGFLSKAIPDDYKQVPRGRFADPITPAEIENLARYVDDYVGDPSIPKSDLRVIGKRLFESLLSGNLTRSYDRFWGNLAGFENDRGPLGMRLRLVFDVVEHRDALNLAMAQPWELLYDPFIETFLCQRDRTPITRFLTTPEPRIPRRLGAKENIRVLVLDCTPQDCNYFDPEKEKQEIQKNLRRTDRFEVNFLSNPALDDLRDRLIQRDFHIVHFIGHGCFDESTGEGLLAFTDDQRNTLPVSGERLAAELDVCPSLRLVVLNSCFGATVPRKGGWDPYSGVATALVRAGLPAVVAMQFTVSYDATRSFSRAFYRSLGQMRSVEMAVSEGRYAIYVGESGSPEWATPVLFLNSKHGYLFGTPERIPSAPEAPRPSRRKKRLRLGIRSFADRTHTADLEEKADDVLDLTAEFDGRRIRDPKRWKDYIYPRLGEFLRGHTNPKRPLLIDWAAHWTIAFAAGYILEAKGGFDISILQRSQRGTSTFGQKATAAQKDYPTWCEEEEVGLSPKGADVALAIAISRPVMKDVLSYLSREFPDGFSRVIPATLAPEPGQLSIQDGWHAYRLAQDLEAKIRSRNFEERGGVLHLFAAAPNAFVFRLGQLAQPFGAIQLHEHNFENRQQDDYSPSLLLA